jgi:hypothetical protein
LVFVLRPDRALKIDLRPFHGHHLAASRSCEELEGERIAHRTREPRCLVEPGKEQVELHIGKRALARHIAVDAHPGARIGAGNAMFDCLGGGHAQRRDAHLGHPWGVIGNRLREIDHLAWGHLRAGRAPHFGSTSCRNICFCSCPFANPAACSWK